MKRHIVTPQQLERLAMGDEYVDAKNAARRADGSKRKARAIAEAEEWIKTVRARKAKAP